MAPRRFYSYLRLLAPAALFCGLFTALPACAQSRLNDHDVEKIMKNLKEDSKDFYSTFSSSLKKSGIRNTNRESDAKAMTDNFQKQTDEMWKRFKDHKRAEADVQRVIEMAGKIDQMVYSLQLDNKTTLSWERVRSELHDISAAFGLQSLGSRGE